MAGIKDKLSVEKIKSLGLKHGEKLVLGLVGVFVLMSLVGTQWATYKKVPSELTGKLDTADKVIEGAQWTQEEQDKYPDYSPKTIVQTMLSNMSSSPYNFTTPNWTPPGGQKEPFRDPVYVAVSDLIAESGRTLLAQNKDESEMDEESSDAEGALSDDDSLTTEEPDDIDLDDDVKGRVASDSAGNAGGGLGSAGGGGAGYDGAFEQQIFVESDPNEMMSGMYSGSGGEGMMGGSMGVSSNVKGVPVRYISVRGIFDLRKQIQNYARAMQTDEDSAQSMVEFIDFKLERQTAETKVGPWEADWETVDIDVAKDYIAQTVDFDLDPVSSGVRNSVITMPLPARLLGVWRNKVNHPRIKAFELSDEEMEAEATLNRAILDEYRKANKAIVQRISPGGFGDQQLNMTQMQGDYLSAAGNNKQLDKAFEEEFEGTDAQIRKKLIQKIKDQVDASGNLVLFRYIDFDLEPGKSYRYRVQLVLRNPNFDTPIDQVNTPSVVEGQTRDTPVSEPSTIASVPADYAYFLSHVKPPRGVTNSIAEMTVYEWFDETGTMIKGKLAMELGDYIGGKAKTYVLRPAEMTFEEEKDVPFTTSDLLIDAIQVGRLDSSLHGDLKLPPKLTRGDNGIPAEVLVVDSNGRFKAVDPISLASSEQRYSRYYNAEKTPFEGIKNAGQNTPDAGGSSLFGGAGGEGSEEMAGMMEMMGQTGAGRLGNRKRNSTRIGGGGSSMMGGGYDGGGPPSGGSRKKRRR